MSHGLTSQLARTQVQTWVRRERSAYADQKYSGANRTQVYEAIASGRTDETIDGFLSSYLDRARLLGLDTPAGRQALGKAATTILDFLEHAVVAFGDMPAPGVPSGQIDVWVQT